MIRTGNRSVPTDVSPSLRRLLEHLSFCALWRPPKAYCHSLYQSCMPRVHLLGSISHTYASSANIWMPFSRPFFVVSVMLLTPTMQTWVPCVCFLLPRML